MFEETERMKEIIVRLETRFPVTIPFQSDAFSVLIRTILSQNTSEQNSSLAFERLNEHYSVKPEILSKLDPNDLKPLIRVAGLHKVRSNRIIEISKIILKRFHGSLESVLELPLHEARRTLLSLHGVGFKTADILLCFVGGVAIMPIDTNIFRVVNRIGFVEGRNYERVRSVLEKLIPPEKIPKMHLLLIKHGREICKPRQPNHKTCPINNFCDFIKTMP